MEFSLIDEDLAFSLCLFDLFQELRDPFHASTREKYSQCGSPHCRYRALSLAKSSAISDLLFEFVEHSFGFFHLSAKPIAAVQCLSQDNRYQSV